MNEKWKVGILLFHEVEVLDFAGPFEVFSVTLGKGDTDKAFDVSIVAEKMEPIKARNGLTVFPDFDFEHAPQLDILIVPGGYGAEEIEIKNPVVINWIRETASTAKLTASVCTGAFLLAKSGLLDGKTATTHWMDIDRLEREFPRIKVVRGKKYIDEESIMTSGGISAGINMSLYIVRKLLGKEIAEKTAKRMEYDIVIPQ